MKYSKQLVFYICLISLSHPLIGQTHQEIIHLLSKADSLFNVPAPTAQSDSIALSFYLKANDFYRNEQPQDTTLLTVYNQIGILYQVAEQFEEAKKYYIKRLNLIERLKPLKNYSSFSTELYLGNIYYYQFQFDSSEYYYKLAEKTATTQEKVYEQERLYNSIGAMYFSLGNYSQSINYFNKAIRVIKHNYPNSLEKTIPIQNNVASALKKLGKYNLALTHCYHLLRFNTNQNNLFNNIGLMHLALANHDSALHYFNKAKFTTIKDKIVQNNGMAQAYSGLKMFDHAEQLYKKTIQLNTEQFHFKNEDLATSYIGLGKIYEEKKEFSQSLNFYQKALVTLHSSFDEAADIFANPETPTLTISGLKMFEVLDAKAHALHSAYAHNRSGKYLEASLATYQQAVYLSEHIRKSYDSDEAKLFFVNQVFPVFEKALEVAYQLYQLNPTESNLEAAFQLSEKSKSTVLSESLRNLEIMSVAHIPDSLLSQESNMKKQVTALKIRLTSSADSGQSAQLQGEIRDLEIELGNVYKAFEANPEFYRLKYDTSAITTRQVQENLLNRQSALVEYFLGKKHLYIFVLTSTQKSLKKIDLSPAFWESFHYLKDWHYQHPAGKAYQGYTHSQRLYQHLIAPIEDMVQGKKYLRIVPDGDLHYLPFEILTESNGQYAPFLIQTYVMSYGYSAKLMLESSLHEQHNGQNLLLAMAPFSGSSQEKYRNNYLRPLNASAREVQTIGGQVYLKEKATKSRFLKTSSDFNIIHLATHANADSEDPLNSYIAFYPQNFDSVSDYRLYTNELYNLNLKNVKLVVLSACETGMGKLVRGEGIISLARGFTYAGCPNIITTLWKAEDNITAQLSVALHRYLKEGFSKDEALQKAKTDYLKANQDPHLRDPFYWANFVFVGDPQPMYFSMEWLYIVGSGALLLIMLLAGGWIWKKRKMYTP
ncbi:CHAT domain-containing tetratricopeptide repeat protein [Rapidithrix thailandica]|uniref:CHAT domain-containing tetratricopeptide repeat protein n=1 Tax=Rapidithrix thailandica TaxID=413964 RepID=A0AAW9S2J9_9BACT